MCQWPYLEVWSDASCTVNVQLDSTHLWLELYRFSAPTRLTEVLVHSSKLLAKTAKNDFDLNVVSVVSVKSQPDI